MASLKKRGSTYAITFTQRVDGQLVQKTFGLSVTRKDRAEVLKARYEDQYRLGEIDPFDGVWSPRAERVPKPPPSSGMTLHEAGNRFLASRAHVRGRTRADYEAQLGRLLLLIGASMPVRLVTADDVRSYAFQPHLSTASQTTYLRFCRMLFKWLAAEGLVRTDVAAGVRYPKRSDKVSQKTIGEAQLQAVLRAYADDKRHKILADQKRGRNVWFRPMAATFFYAGLRAREAVELQWQNVDTGRGFLVVSRSKSGRERAIPIRSALRPYLLAWYRYCGRPTHGLVFPKARRPDGDLPLDPAHVSKTFKTYARAAGLPESVNLHGLRHSCATDLLRRGMGINDVATILGHSSIEVTRIYEHLDRSDIQSKMQRLGL